MVLRVCGAALALAVGGGLSAAQQTASLAAKPQAAGSQWSGIYSDAQARRGEPLYAENCAFCHGAQLEGTISAPPLTAAALSARWHDQTLADLFDYQQTFMPWTSPGGFGRQQNVDILAYILMKGGLPAGADLPIEPEAQRRIRILATKP
jgi:cytochrome c5